MRTGNLEQILRLEVPVVVLLGECQMSVERVLALLPGSIIELPKTSSAELELVIANKKVGCGMAVKVGENFGIRLTYVGDLDYRLGAAFDASSSQSDDAALDELAMQMLAGNG